MDKIDAILDIFFNTLGYDLYGFDYDMDKWIPIDPFDYFVVEMKAHGFDVYNITDHGDELEIIIDGETYTCLKRIDDITNSQEALALYGMEHYYQGIYWYRYYDLRKD
jgi:hypothetical protein